MSASLLNSSMDPIILSVLKVFTILQFISVLFHYLPEVVHFLKCNVYVSGPIMSYAFLSLFILRQYAMHHRL